MRIELKHLILFILCMHLFCACTDSDVVDETEETELSVQNQIPSNISSVIDNNISEPDFVEETQNVVITDEEITTLIDNYLLYIRYTTYDSLPTGSEFITLVDEFNTSVETNYYKVVDEKYDTWDEWAAFLESIFSGTCLENALANQTHIKNFDGYTYHDGGAMGLNRSPHTYEVNETPQNEITVTIIEKDVFTDENYLTEFLCILTDDGWRFQERIS